ncbi:TPA_asm: P3 [Corylus betacytorhabdovirus 1]|nr:TPA_asm: P3 [Corylus betacytorhabdovirus 1]
MDLLALYDNTKKSQDEKQKTKLTKKGHKRELIHEQVSIFQPISLPYLWIRKMLDTVSRVVKYESVQIHYHTYMRSISGLVSVRVIDTRMTDPKAKVLLYTVFRAERDQYMKITLNVAVGPMEKEDPIKIYVLTHNLAATAKVNYGNIKMRPHWICSKKDMTSDPLTFESIPRINWCRGIDVSDTDISKIHAGSLLEF